MTTEITLGGSDANRIMNDEAMAVFEEKIGTADRKDLSAVLPVQMGIVTEELNCRWYIKNGNLAKGVYLVENRSYVTGIAHRNPGPYPSDSNREFKDQDWFSHIYPQTRLLPERHGQIGLKHPKIPWLVGHLDGLVINNNSKPIAVFEAKHTGTIAKWNPPEAVVKRNIWQCLLYMMIAEVTSCELSVFYGNKEWQLHNIRLEDHVQDGAILLSRLHQMYNAIQNKEPLSDWDTEQTIEPVLVNERRSYSVEEMRSTNWYPEFAAAEREYVETHNPALVNWAAEKKLKGLVPNDAKFIDGALVTISIARNNRKSIEVKDAHEDSRY